MHRPKIEEIGRMLQDNLSFGNATSPSKAETLTNLIRVRGLYLFRRWLLLNRGGMGHVAAEFLSQHRCIVRINLRVVASKRDRDIRQRNSLRGSTFLFDFGTSIGVHTIFKIQLRHFSNAAGENRPVRRRNGIPRRAQRERIGIPGSVSRIILPHVKCLLCIR